MRNNEYREKLVAKIHDGMFHELRTAAQKELEEYDRLHPETIQVLNVIVNNLPVVCLYDKGGDCTIQLIDGTLNVTIE